MIDIKKIWNIKANITQVTGNTWEIGEDYFLKKSTQSALGNNLTFLQLLKNGNIPVAEPVTSQKGNMLESFQGECYLLTKRLKGVHITNIYQADYETIAQETGRIVAKLHKAFRDCERSMTFNNILFIEELDGWVQSALQNSQWKSISEDEFKFSVSQLRDCYEQLPKQLIHRDLHYGNMLFDNMVFTGYIDFDLSKRDARIFDLCYFLLGLLNDHNNEKDIPVWFEIIHYFIKGYEEVEILESIEKELIPAFMECIELLFAAYFLNEGNVEFEQNAAAMYHCIRKNRNSIQNIIN